MLNTIEYQIPLLANDASTVAFFVDHGTVERTFGSATTASRSARACGSTSRRSGPLPLALDFAVPVVQAPGDIKQLFSLSVGLFGGP